MDGRTEIISRLVAEHSRKLIAYSRLICRDLELARDAVADTFYKLCELESIDEEKAAAWLYKTCRNRTIDILRKRKPCAELDEAEISKLAEESDKPDVLRREKLLFLIAKLPPMQREILMLRYFSDLKYSEIALALGVSQSFVGVAISRALETLKRDMQNEK